MFSEVDEFMLNTAAKAFGVSYLGLSLSLLFCFWQGHSCNSCLMWLSAIPGLVGMRLLSTNRIRATNPGKLRLSNSVWKNCAEAFPILFRYYRWWSKSLLFGGMALGFSTVIISSRISYYLLSGLSLPALETKFFTDILLPAVILLGSATFLSWIVFASVLTILVRKWKRVVELSTDDQATMHALDKLTTFELLKKKNGKADAYSARLLALAEKMCGAVKPCCN